jgi:hypothetical protein
MKLVSVFVAKREEVVFPSLVIAEVRIFAVYRKGYIVLQTVKNRQYHIIELGKESAFSANMIYETIFVTVI